MLEFKRLEYEDRDTVGDYFRRDNERRLAEGAPMICDSLLGTTFFWREYYNIRYAIYEDSLILLASGGGTDMFSFPIGGDTVAALHAVREYAHSIGIALYFCFISEYDLHFFEECYDVVFSSEEPDWSDYVYDKASVTDFAGKHFHGQKNMLNRFKRTDPTAAFVPMESSLCSAVSEYISQWFQKYSDGSPMSAAEEKAIYELLRRWDESKMTGGIVTSKDGICGFTAGECVGDTVFVHVEKAEQNRAGAYQFLASEYLRKTTDPSVIYVNREEDMGISGIRKAKQSLHPIRMLKKYTLYCC